jgi:hypothetical protein
LLYYSHIIIILFVFFHDLQFLPYFKLYEKPIRKNIFIDWGHEISKWHIISENIKKIIPLTRPYIRLFNKHLKKVILSERPCRSPCKFWNPTTTISGRKVRSSERGKIKPLILATTFLPAAHALRSDQCLFGFASGRDGQWTAG